MSAPWADLIAHLFRVKREGPQARIRFFYRRRGVRVGILFALLSERRRLASASSVTTVNAIQRIEVSGSSQPPHYD